jgi:hypothetical protein
MKLKNILVKMANHFDNKGEFELANEIDDTLNLIEKEEAITNAFYEDDPTLLLEEKGLEDITEEELNSFTAVLMIVKDELQDRLGIDAQTLNETVLDIVKNYHLK